MVSNESQYELRLSNNLNVVMSRTLTEVSSDEDKSGSSFDEMTHLYRRCLRIYAIVPFEGRDYTYFATRLLIIYGILASMFNCGMYAVYMISQPGVPSIDGVCELVIVTGVSLRYYLLLPRRREFAALLDECRRIWLQCNEEERNCIHQFEAKVRLLFKCLLGSGIVAHSMYTFGAVFMTYSVAKISNTTEHQHFLAYQWFTENGAELWPGYKINFVLQQILVINAMLVATTIDTAAPLLIMIGAGYFRALQLRLYRVYDKALANHNDEVDREFIACSRLHQQILDYCSRIDKITRGLFFVQLLTSGYNTSFIGLKLAGTDPDRFKYVPVVLFNVGQLFICQWAPDRLVDESVAVSTAVYAVSVPWMRRQVHSLLVPFIARAQRPVYMTAGGVVNLSLESFGSMLKTAMSFFTLLRNLSV